MSRVRIAHLSDPHFGTLNEGAEAALLTSLHELKPSLILLTGDITQRARRSQFRAAKAFTKRLSPTPIIAVPGNHDIPLFNIFARLFYPYAGFRKLFKDRLEKDFAFKDVRVIGLNSTSRWRHVQGDFNIERIKRRFHKSPHHPKITIAAFHHPMDCAKNVDEKNLLKGRDQAMQIFARAEVDLIVGGHIHDPYYDLSTSRYPKVKRSAVIAVAGTCLSWRTRKGAPNSFNLIDVDTAEVPLLTITRYDLQKEAGFQPKIVHRFRRTDPDGWSRS